MFNTAECQKIKSFNTGDPKWTPVNILNPHFPLDTIYFLFQNKKETLNNQGDNN